MPFDEYALTIIGFYSILFALLAYVGHLVALTGRISQKRVQQRELVEYGGVQPALVGAGAGASMVSSSAFGEATLTLGAGRAATRKVTLETTAEGPGGAEAAALAKTWTWFGRAGLALTLLGWLSLTLALLTRWNTSGHAPWVSLYEVTLVLSWGTTTIYLLLVEGWMKVRSLGAFVLTLVFCLQIYALAVIPTELKEISPLVPALRSDWLYIHVSNAIIAYSAFGVAAGAALMYLFKYYKLGNWTRVLPSLAATDEFMFRAIAVGFPFQTLLLITGAYWAQVAWSKAWSWDPKEVWALITWLAFAALLHVRVQRGWRGTTVAWMALAGFAIVMITFVGVNYLVTWFGLDSMHTYSGETPGLLGFGIFGALLAALLGSLALRDVTRRRKMQARRDEREAQPQTPD